MNVIGISGLHHSVPYKKQQFPNLEPREYRMVQGLDSAAALVNRTGVVAAAAEERFTYDKGTGAFPHRAIRYCLQAGGLDPTQVDFIAHGFDYAPQRPLFEMTPSGREMFEAVFAPEAQVRVMEQLLPDFGWAQKYVAVPHHLAHAASAFYLSGFTEGLILVVDAMGEAVNTTVAVGTPEGIKVIQQNPGAHSLGHLYGFFTLHLGFFMGLDEYKVMGLAPYGNPSRFGQKILDLVKVKPDGTFTIPLMYRKTPGETPGSYAGVRAALVELFGPPREPESALSKDHMDLAAGLQWALQEVLLQLLRKFQRDTGQKNLCTAGGVALNCSANGKILHSGLFERVFVQPASGDDGTALGAALYVQHTRDPEARPARMKMPLWGPQYQTEQVREALVAKGLKFATFESDEALAREVADAIGQGKVVAWYQGRMEFGPRALGSRSILADPRDPGMRARINTLVKKREEFRPFAPVVKSSEASRIFDIPQGQERAFAHMLFVTPVREAYRSQLPAITHVDGSARVQTLEQEDGPRLYALLEEVGRRTGLPVLLNTSFNVRGQPIVCTPEEAIDTFSAYNLDLLVADGFVVRRHQ